LNCLKPISVLVLLGLTGCAGMSTRFDCAAKPGVHCKSIGEVNTLVDEGILPKKSVHSHQDKKPCCAAPILGANEINEQDNVFSIWMAPFKDAEGIQHSEAYLTLPDTEPVRSHE